MLIGPRNLWFTPVSVLRRGRLPVEHFDRGSARPAHTAAPTAHTTALTAHTAAAAGPA